MAWIMVQYWCFPAQMCCSGLKKRKFKPCSCTEFESPVVHVPHFWEALISTDFLDIYFHKEPFCEIAPDFQPQNVSSYIT